MFKWMRWREGLLTFLLLFPIGLGMRYLAYHHLTPDGITSVLIFATLFALARTFLAPVIQQKFGSPDPAEDKDIL